LRNVKFLSENLKKTDNPEAFTCRWADNIKMDVRVLTELAGFRAGHSGGFL
jgi:hypothetical protein